MMTSEYLLAGENACDTRREKQLKVVSTALSQPEGNKAEGLTVVVSGLTLSHNFSLYFAYFPNFTESSFMPFIIGDIEGVKER